MGVPPVLARLPVLGQPGSWDSVVQMLSSCGFLTSGGPLIRVPCSSEGQRVTHVLTVASPPHVVQLGIILKYFLGHSAFGYSQQQPVLAQQGSVSPLLAWGLPAQGPWYTRAAFPGPPRPMRCTMSAVA